MSWEKGRKGNSMKVILNSRRWGNDYKGENDGKINRIAGLLGGRFSVAGGTLGESEMQEGKEGQTLDFSLRSRTVGDCGGTSRKCKTGDCSGNMADPLW